MHSSTEYLKNLKVIFGPLSPIQCWVIWESLHILPHTSATLHWRKEKKMGF